MWQIKDISDDAYFRIGDIFGGFDNPLDRHKELVVSNSFMKQVFDTNMYHRLVAGAIEVDEKLQDIFDVGKAFHCYTLENSKFLDRYRISDIKDATSDLTRVSKQDFEFINSCYANILKKYPYIIKEENAELAIFGEIDDVPVKCKVDKLHIEKSGKVYQKVEIIDLKGVYFDQFKLKKDSTKNRWELRRKICDAGYDLQAYFYTRMVEEWLLSINQHCEVVFSLLICSKETYQVQKFQLGSEILESGRLKFESVWGDIRDFVVHGKVRLVEDEII